MTTFPIDTSDAPSSASQARRYTNIAIILHWVIAVAIAFQMIGGKWMVSAGAAATGSVFTVFQVHKTVGLTILSLTLARIIWRLANPAPVLPAGMTRFERSASQVTHIGFYGFLILIPLSGWAMASVSPTGVPTFFLLLEGLPFVHLPLLGDAGLTERHSAEAFLKGVHHNLSLAMGLLIALHVLAALKHQFIARDNLLARMIISARTLPNSVASLPVAVLAATATVLFLVGGIAWGIGQTRSYQPASTAHAEAVPSSSNAWVIDHEASSLGLTFTFAGNTVEGTIGNWSADIVFNPADLGAANALIIIDMTSLTLTDGTLQAQSSGSDGFDLANHATATYAASSFAAVGEGSFVAEGTLTLRGLSVDVPLAFTFAEQEGVATVAGSAPLNRIDFGIGAVGAADEVWISHGVDVAFELTATRP
ncbi:MAG: cytochrome b/b6 domain-containing protein [Devosiaceae bacterium]